MPIFLTFMLAMLSQCVVVNTASATPSQEIINELNAQVLRVKVKHNNGNHGFGSAVVIGKNQVVTNCHVITDAHDVRIIANGTEHHAITVKPDWYHDLCILTVTDLDLPSAKIGSSKNLKSGTSVFTVGYPDKTTYPVNTFGIVEETFQMDSSVVIRATSPFKLGASGGGFFDDAGTLVGIVTLKSRGRDAYYYYMPVEWVQALMGKPDQTLGAKNQAPFWAAMDKKLPFFMRIVQPYIAQDWQALLEISNEWVSYEPDSEQSWFYLAMAEYKKNNINKAEEHLRKVLILNENNLQAIYLLNKILEAERGHDDLISASLDINH